MMTNKLFMNQIIVGDDRGHHDRAYLAKTRLPLSYGYKNNFRYNIKCPF